MLLLGTHTHSYQIHPQLSATGHWAALVEQLPTYKVLRSNAPHLQRAWRLLLIPSLQGIKLAIFQAQAFPANLKTREEQTLLIESEWTPCAEKLVLQMCCRFYTLSCERHKGIPNVSCCVGDLRTHLKSSEPLKNLKWIDFGPCHFTLQTFLFISLPRLMPRSLFGDPSRELLACRLTAFNFLDNMCVSFWDIKTDYCHRTTQGSWMYGTLEVKWETSSWTEDSLNFPHELVNFSFVMKEL